MLIIEYFFYSMSSIYKKVHIKSCLFKSYPLKYMLKIKYSVFFINNTYKKLFIKKKISFLKVYDY
jgi:hypothetical protein